MAAVMDSSAVYLSKQQAAARRDCLSAREAARALARLERAARRRAHELRKGPGAAKKSHKWSTRLSRCAII